MPVLASTKSAIESAGKVLAQTPVVIDTETTGLDKEAEIVEICVSDHLGNVLLNTLVRPTKPIPADAMKIHHITNEMVKTAPPWPVIWPTLRSLIISKPLAIYNADFDMRMMRQTHGRYRLVWKDAFRSFCIMKCFAEFIGEWDPYKRSYRYHSLDNAGKRLKVNIPNSHRAVDDTLLALEVLKAIANTNPDE
jgi:DNA polymerase-3 subunit epsilon